MAMVDKFLSRRVGVSETSASRKRTALQVASEPLVRSTDAGRMRLNL